MVRSGPKLQAANGESLKVLGQTKLNVYDKRPYDVSNVLRHRGFESELHIRDGLAQDAWGPDLL